MPSHASARSVIRPGQPAAGIFGEQPRHGGAGDRLAATRPLSIVDTVPVCRRSDVGL